MNNILKQTFTNMRRQPLLTMLSIAGSALAICMIMIVMMTREVQNTDFGCEPNRSRTLYIQHSHCITDNGHSQSWGSGIEYKAVRDVFVPMKTPDAVAVYSPYHGTLDVAEPGKEEILLNIKAANRDYFKIVNLNIREGKVPTKEECESNAPVVLLSGSAARKIFGTDTGITGRTVTMYNHDFMVVGVTDDVSPLFRMAYSDIWVPINPAHADTHILSASSLGTPYNLCVALMARDADDFEKIRNESDRMLAEYNRKNSPDTLDLMDQPDTQEVYINHVWSNEGPDIKAINMRYMLIFVILLIVPAINIASMTQSRLRQRKAEIGVRRAFGATRAAILWQAVTESMIQTLIAGVIGLILCFAACSLASEYIFTPYWTDSSQDITFDPRILFSPMIYCQALIFCVILNTLSSVVPAWRASRENIVEVLK